MIFTIVSFSLFSSLTFFNQHSEEISALPLAYTLMKSVITESDTSKPSLVKK